MKDKLIKLKNGLVIVLKFIGKYSWLIIAAIFAVFFASRKSDSSSTKPMEHAIENIEEIKHDSVETIKAQEKEGGLNGSNN
jgi:sugar phosphate permease